MLVAHEFFDALPFHLIEVRGFDLLSNDILILLENTPRLERGLDHLRPRPGCQNYPQAILVAFVPEMPEEFLEEDDVRAFGSMTQEHYDAWRHIEASFPST
ncbi:hypothetical protein EDB83DRAFT_2514036 [Lactarius deliciosus]|nr:hypothetical protein EDB83DRAFT_2514036 [Lactarius deliciosus]